MLKKNLLVGICVFFLGLGTSAYAADTEVILEDDTANSGFAVKNSSGETTVRAGGDGNVGVGITNPSQKLDVNGGIKVGNTTMQLPEQSVEPEATGNLIELASLTPSVDWNLDAPTSDVNYLSVSHSQEINGKLITAYNSVNGGNNKNWIFPILIPTIIDKIGNLDPGVFKNSSNQNALINKLNEVMDAIDNGDYVDSLNKLKNDILKKTNGCATIGEPDKDDWITDCDAQATIYPVVLNAIALLEQLI